MQVINSLAYFDSQQAPRGLWFVGLVCYGRVLAESSDLKTVKAIFMLIINKYTVQKDPYRLTTSTGSQEIVNIGIVNVELVISRDYKCLSNLNVAQIAFVSF